MFSSLRFRHLRGSIGRRSILKQYKHWRYRYQRESSTAAASQMCSKGSTNMKVFNDIVKSENDDRQYRGLILENGMKVLLICDPNTDKSAASMDVNIGYQSDPEDLPGLAHFCEHMLFLGTEKYPKEDEYHKFLSQHGGAFNAYTSNEHTNYHFDVGYEHLSGVLDRFGQFFISPLFDANCTDREVKAVNSEHEKNIMSDAWRIQRLDQITSNPKHAYSKFGTGNSQSLDLSAKEKGLELREELLKFHQKYYSSNIMCLSLLGRESLDEQMEMVKDLFLGAANKNYEVVEYKTSPCREEDKKKRCNVVPVQDIRFLILDFPIPDMHEFYDFSPGGYLSHLIGHEGPGSLLSELKARGWVNSLEVGQKGGARGFDFFSMQVDLTEDGMDHIEDTIECMFQYIALLKHVGPKDWIYQEIKDMEAISFRFKDKEKPSAYVSKVTKALQYYPIEKILTAGNLLGENKPEVITKLLDCLSPDNMKVMVVGKAFEGETDRKEEWYGAQYKIVPFSEELILRWKSVSLNKNLQLPEPNEFIPSKLDLEHVPKQNPKSPKLLKHDNFSQVWFKQDDIFKLPKATMSFDFYSPYAYVDPHHANMVHLFVELFVDSMSEYSYAADIAGLGFDLKPTAYGVVVGIDGYEDKQKVLLRKIISKMARFKVSSKRFNLLKEVYQRDLENFKADQPYNHSAYYSQILRSELAWTKNELSDALPDLTLEALKDFIPQFMSRLHFEALIHGNIRKREAKRIVELVEEILKNRSHTKALLPSQLVRHRDIELPQGSSYVYKHQNQIRDNSAIQMFLQIGLQNKEENVLLDLITQVISEPCFNILRTKEQLGYVVHCGTSRSNGTQGLRFIVQSDRNPNYLEARVEAFIQHAEEILNKMEDSEFERYKSALKSRRLEKPKKLKSQTLKYWGEIMSQQYMYERDEIEMEYLDGITKKDLIDFYEKFINVKGTHRAKLTTYIVGKDIESCPVVINSEEHNKSLEEEDFLECPEVPASEEITSVLQFKQSRSLFPRVPPYIDLAAVTIEE